MYSQNTREHRSRPSSNQKRSKESSRSESRNHRFDNHSKNIIESPKKSFGHRNKKDSFESQSTRSSSKSNSRSPSSTSRSNSSYYTETDSYSNSSSYTNDSAPNECKRKGMTLVEYANTTTFHGCSNFLTEHPFTFRQLFWAWIFIGALAYCSYSAWTRVIYYFSYQHITKIDEIDLQEEADGPAKPESVKVVNANDPNADMNFNSEGYSDNRKQMTFPAITICNLNMFKVQYLTVEDWKNTAHHLFDIIDANGEFILPRSVTDYFTGQSAQNLVKAVEAFRADLRRKKKKRRRHLREKRTAIVKNVENNYLKTPNFSLPAEQSNYKPRNYHKWQKLQKMQKLLKISKFLQNNDELDNISPENHPKIRIRRAETFVKPESTIPELIQEKNRIVTNDYPKLVGWNMIDLLNRTGFSKDDLVLECSYRGEDCKDDKFWKMIFTGL